MKLEGKFKEALKVLEWYLCFESPVRDLFKDGNEPATKEVLEALEKEEWFHELRAGEIHGLIDEAKRSIPGYEELTA